MVRIILFLTLSVGCLSHEENRGHFSRDRPRHHSTISHGSHPLPPISHGDFEPPRPHTPISYGDFELPRPHPPISYGDFEPPRPPPSSSRGDSEPVIFEGCDVDNSPMQTLYSWKQVDFTFQNDNIRQQMIRNQQFIPINTMILDVEVYDDGRVQKVFVSLPRVRPGVPVTLATVSQQRRNGEYLLKPFPDWAAHNALNEGRCDDGITSVFRMHLDECGRLWVLDSGSINGFTSNATIGCQPKIWIYDLRNNNRLVGKFPIPQSMIASNSLLVTIAVDIRRGQCNDAFAYIADSIAYKMIVFNLKNNEFWRINSIQFFPYPDQSRFTVNGESFELSGGIFGLALGPVYNGDKRILYFNAIDSVRQSWVDTADLRNQNLWRESMNAKPRTFNLFGGSRPSQSTVAAMHDQGIMFFGLVSSNEVACWNTQTKFEDGNIVRLVKDDAALQFVSGVKLSRTNLYVVTGRLQKYMNNNINKDEVNYRVLVGDLQQMTRQTKCEVKLVNIRLDTESYSPDMESVDEPAELLASQQS